MCGVFLLRFLFHIVDNRALLRCCCPTYLHTEWKRKRERKSGSSADVDTQRTKSQTKSLSNISIYI